MFICVDTHYTSKKTIVAGVVFKDIESSVIEKEYQLVTTKAENYLPGSFYLRELPGILQLLKKVDLSIHTAIVDGYVWLSAEREPGLGAHLHDALEQKIPVIGVAKSPYKDVTMALQVFRGRSAKPLYVTAVGIETGQAAHLIKNMNGKYRLPTLLKHVDTLSRKAT